MVPRMMQTVLMSLAMRPSLQAPSTSPCCLLFLDWGKGTDTKRGTGEGLWAWLHRRFRSVLPLNPREGRTPGWYHRSPWSLRQWYEARLQWETSLAFQKPAALEYRG